MYVATEVGSYKTKIARGPIFLSQSLLVLECPPTDPTMTAAIPSLSEHPLLITGSSFLIILELPHDQREPLPLKTTPMSSEKLSSWHHVGSYPAGTWSTSSSGPGAN